jgi:hypothetical protein
MRRARLPAAALVFLALAGGICYHVTPPAQITVKEPTDTLVTRVEAFFAKNQVPLDSIEQDSEIPSKVVVSKWVHLDDHEIFEWMSCGSSASGNTQRQIDDVLWVNVSFKVFLTATPDSTTVRVKMDDDQAGRPPGGRCSSNGKFERALLASLTVGTDTTVGR